MKPDLRDPSTPASGAPAPERDEELEGISTDEERVLMRVQKNLAAQTIAPSNGGTDYDADLLALRDQIAEARAEDVPPLIQEMERLQQIANRRAQLSTPPVDSLSPYFGRMVLEEGNRKREVLIGKATYLDGRTGIRIVDWRDAPVSRLFYRYDEGDDYEENFGGREVQGNVLTRRSLAVVEGSLRRIVSPQGTFLKRRDKWERAGASTRLSGGAGAADRPDHYHKPGKLGIGRDGDGRADKFLPEIASLIDPRQFELITKASSGLVVIQGGAGSGKTTIGLHRLAYLAFEDAKRFKVDRMLIVVFNTALARYISKVLPALGVEGVPVVTYEAWVQKLRHVHLPRVPRKYNDETPTVVVRMKKHPAMLRAIDAHVGKLADRAEEKLQASLGGTAGADEAISRWRKSAKKPLAVRVELLSLWANGDEEGAKSPPLPVRHAVERASSSMREFARDVFTAFADITTDRAALGAIFKAHGAGALSEEDLDEAHKWCAARIGAAVNDMEARADVAEEKKEERDSRKSLDDEEIADVDPDEERERRVGIDGRDEEEEARATMDHEDDTLLLRVWQRMRGALRKPGAQRGRGPGAGRGGAKETLKYEHILIDEAQDLSPVEMSVVLDTVSAQKSVTLAGDVAQRLHMDNGFTNWRGVLDDLGLQSTDIEPLEVSYRSTKEIIDFATHVLGPLSGKPGKATREGAPIELFRFAHSGDAVGFLGEALRDLVRAEPLASIAIVSRYPEQADIYYRGLANAEVPNLRRIADQDFPFKAGIDVTDVRQVKGLEFDYVVLIEVSAASYPADDEARHLLHIAATRAAHQLWVTSTGEPSKLIPQELIERGF